MANKNIAVFAIYSQVSTLENALNELKQAGFRHEDISVLFPENLGSKELTTVKSSKGPEGMAAGAGSGAVLGGALGWLVGIGALAIPGIGPFIAAGPIVAALAGVGVGGAVGGISAVPTWEFLLRIRRKMVFNVLGIQRAVTVVGNQQPVVLFLGQ